MSGAETAFRSVINLDWVPLSEKRGCNACVGLRHGVFIDHSAHMAGVAWHLLTTHMVSGAGNPILREFAVVAIDVFVHLGTAGQINYAHHALLKSDAAQVGFDATRITDLFVDSTSCFAEKVILEGDMSGIAGKVLARPKARLLRHMLRRLAPLMRHESVCL